MDNYYALRFIFLLTRPWEDTEAFKLGLIDDKGEVLKSPVTDDEKNALSKFHLLVFNIKKLLEKLPLGKSTVARYAAALYLIKEQMSPALVNKDLFTEAFIEHLVVDGRAPLNLVEQLRENTKYIGEDGSTAGMGGSVTTGVDGLDTVLGGGKPNKPKKKSRQQLWTKKTY